MQSHGVFGRCVGPVCFPLRACTAGCTEEKGKVLAEWLGPASPIFILHLLVSWYTVYRYRALNKKTVQTFSMPCFVQHQAVSPVGVSRKTTHLLLIFMIPTERGGVAPLSKKHCQVRQSDSAIGRFIRFIEKLTCGVCS